jgi:membrane associated rhomboid family serine protease
MPIRLTRAVKVLAIACFALFLIQQTWDQFFGGNVAGVLGLVPSGFILQHRLWQILTYSFLHADVTHLFLNLMMLVFIGGEIEALWGTPKFVRYYLICTTGAGAIYLLLQGLKGGEGLYTPMVGASGGIYGLLVAYGLLFAERTLLFMMLFPMKAKHFVWILVLVELFTTVFSGQRGLSGVAHLGGMISGFATLWVWASLQIRRKRAQAGGAGAGRKKGGKKGNHLRLVSGKEVQGVDDEDPSQRPGKGPKTWH